MLVCVVCFCYHMCTVQHTVHTTIVLCRITIERVKEAFSYIRAISSPPTCHCCCCCSLRHYMLRDEVNPPSLFYSLCHVKYLSHCTFVIISKFGRNVILESMVKSLSCRDKEKEKLTDFHSLSRVCLSDSTFCFELGLN